MIGSAYFQRMLNIWGGNVPLAVASYNAGSGNVGKWVRQYGDPRGKVDVLKWIEAIPYIETRAYVQRVIENSVVYNSMRGSQPQQSAVHVSRYLGKEPPGLIVAAHGRRLRPASSRPKVSRASAPNMRSCSGSSGPSWSRRSPGPRRIGDRSENGDYHLRQQAPARDRPPAVAFVADHEGGEGRRPGLAVVARPGALRRHGRARRRGRQSPRP